LNNDENEGESLDARKGKEKGKAINSDVERYYLLF
jgi:hypothetical protein